MIQKLRRNKRLLLVCFLFVIITAIAYRLIIYSTTESTVHINEILQYINPSNTSDFSIPKPYQLFASSKDTLSKNTVYQDPDGFKNINDTIQQQFPLNYAVENKRASDTVNRSIISWKDSVGSLFRSLNILKDYKNNKLNMSIGTMSNSGNNYMETLAGNDNSSTETVSRLFNNYEERAPVPLENSAFNNDNPPKNITNMTGLSFIDSRPISWKAMLIKSRSQSWTNSWIKAWTDDWLKTWTPPVASNMSTALTSPILTTSATNTPLPTTTAVTTTTRPKLAPPPDVCECQSLDLHEGVQLAIYELSQLDPRNNRTSWKNLDQYHPNLPVMLLRTPKKRCDLMPNVLSIEWRNVHWQQFTGPDMNRFLMYSAFYDNRTKTVPRGGVVRLLLLVKGDINEDYIPWCHLWYNEMAEPVHSRVIRYEFVDWQKKSPERWEPFILTCPTRNTKSMHLVGSVPIAVSLVANPCDKATNLLKVIGKSKKERAKYEEKMRAETKSTLPRIGVCGPALYYYLEDFSVRLVEWLELLKAQGVSNVFLYQTKSIHPNIIKVLRYYEQTGFVELVDFHYPPPYMDEPLLMRTWTMTEREKIFALENIYYTDCILRYKDRHRYLAHFDPDEAPVLKQHNSLPDLLADLLKWYGGMQKVSYGLGWQYFFLDLEGCNKNLKLRPFEVGNKTTITRIPKYFTILRHGQKIIDGKQIKHKNLKSIFDTEDVTGINSHTLFTCAAGYCKNWQRVDSAVAVLGHYRGRCDNKCGHPKNTEDLRHNYRFKNKVVPNAMRVLNELGLLPSS